MAPWSRAALLLAVVLAADQLTKALARSGIEPGDEDPVLPGLELVHVQNEGIAFGARPAYSRALDTVMTFLRDVSEPYLRIFRRFIPPLGPVDISPIVAILVLQIVGRLIIGAVDDTDL